MTSCQTDCCVLLLLLLLFCFFALYLWIDILYSFGDYLKYICISRISPSCERYWCKKTPCLFHCPRKIKCIHSFIHSFTDSFILSRAYKPITAARVEWERKMQTEKETGTSSSCSSFHRDRPKQWQRETHTNRTTSHDVVLSYWDSVKRRQQ